MEKYSFIDRSGKLKLSVYVARVRKHTHPLLGHSTAAWAASIKAAVFYQFFFTGHIYATHFNCLSEMAAELLVWWTGGLVNWPRSYAHLALHCYCGWSI